MRRLETFTGTRCLVRHPALPRKEGEDAPVPFASFETEDGSTVQFFEPEPGDLLVTSSSKIDGRAPELEQPAALYEKLAGEPLPERFNAALESIGHSEDAGPAEFDSGSPATPGSGLQGITKQDLTTQEFAERYCSSGDVELWCWLERTNTSYFSQWVGDMGADAYSYRGSITHRLRRKNTWGNLEDPVQRRGARWLPLARIQRFGYSIHLRVQGL